MIWFEEEPPPGVKGKRRKKAPADEPAGSDESREGEAEVERTRGRDDAPEDDERKDPHAS